MAICLDCFFSILYLDTRKKRAGNPTLVTIVKINCAQSTESPKASFKNQTKKQATSCKKKKAASFGSDSAKAKRRKKSKKNQNSKKKEICSRGKQPSNNILITRTAHELKTFTWLPVTSEPYKNNRGEAEESTSLKKIWDYF